MLPVESMTAKETQAPQKSEHMLDKSGNLDPVNRCSLLSWPRH